MEFNKTVRQIQEMLEFDVKRHSNNVVEFFEAGVAKFMFSEGEAHIEGFNIMSFHVDVPANDAIQYYVQVQATFQNIVLSGEYFMDYQEGYYSDNEAHIMRDLQFEADVVERVLAAQSSGAVKKIHSRLGQTVYLSEVEALRDLGLTGEE